MEAAEDPIQLPNGQLRCLTHHLEVCNLCCVDYSFMREVLEEQAYDEEQRLLRRAKKADLDYKGVGKKCIPGCKKSSSANKRCSACKVSLPLSLCHSPSVGH